MTKAARCGLVLSPIRQKASALRTRHGSTRRLLRAGWCRCSTIRANLKLVRGRSSAENGQQNRKKERKCGGSVRFIHYLFAITGSATAPAPDRCSKGAGNHRPSDTAGSGTGDGLLRVGAAHDYED